MDRYRIPLDNRSPSAGYRDPVPWNEQDEENWELGLVHCPQTGRRLKPERKFCLCASEIDSIKQGVLSVWDEIEKEKDNE
jgi:hypothetical protein